jgi:hypothetical protein
MLAGAFPDHPARSGRGGQAGARAGLSRWIGRVGALVPVGLVAGYGVVVLWLAWGSRGWPLIHDAPLMHYVAWRIGEGAVPYRDLFDMNFPGTYLLHLGVLRTLGGGDAVWRAVDLGWLALSAAAVGALAGRWGRVAGAGAALLFAIVHLAGGAWQAGQRDFFLSGLLVAGALGVARWAEGAGGRALVGSGLVLGAGATIKPHALLLAAALGLLVAVRARRAPLVPVATFGLAVAAAPTAVVAWVAAAGGVFAWRDIVLGYLLPFYSRLGRPPTWAFHRWHVWLPLGAAVVLSLAHALRSRRLGTRHAVAVLGVGYGLAHYVGQSKGWEYHLYPLAAFVAVLAFSEVAVAWARRSALAVPLASVLALALVLTAQKGVEAGNAAWIGDKARIVATLVDDLGDLRPGETAQVLDTTEGGIHALLRLGAVQPTRFLYDFHFFHDESSPAVSALRREFLHDLTRGRPRYVVVFESTWPAAAAPRLDGFPELRRLLEASYRVQRQRAAYVVYAKRDDP